MPRFIPRSVLRRRRQWHQDDIDQFRGVLQHARDEQAAILRTIRDRETRIEAINRRLIQLDRPRDLIRRALQQRST